MFNFDLQLSVLKSLSSTYVDDKRVEISSKDFDVSAEEFSLNLSYLKKEKLIELSSLSIRNSANESGDLKQDQYCLARATLSHSGVKVLADLTSSKVIINKYL